MHTKSTLTTNRKPMHLRVCDENELENKEKNDCPCFCNQNGED